MVAIAYTDAYTDIHDVAVPAPRSPKQKADRPVGDPLVDATTRLLSAPLHHMYAFLWRSGLLVVKD